MDNDSFSRAPKLNEDVFSCMSGNKVSTKASVLVPLEDLVKMETTLLGL